MREVQHSETDKRCRALGLGALLCLAALAGCGERRAGEIERAPRADPTRPAGKPPLSPTDSTPRAPLPSDTAAPARPSESAVGSLRDQYHTAPRDTVGPAVYNGWKQFNLYCARCHGEDATGTTIAPYLIESFRSGKVDHDEFWRVVHGSRAVKGMPNWTGIIEDDKLEAIYGYLKGRSEGKVHPGRPALAPG
jgi:mono/diheme cytochrome c family protein